MAKTLDPIALTMARDACKALSEPQRIAFAIELVNEITDASCNFHLMRLSRLAHKLSCDLGQKTFLDEEAPARVPADFRICKSQSPSRSSSARKGEDPGWAPLTASFQPGRGSSNRWLRIETIFDLVDAAAVFIALIALCFLAWGLS